MRPFLEEESAGIRHSTAMTNGEQAGHVGGEVIFSGLLKKAL
jgi:hypothetical protein